jgi:regulation of enolase protein 1 (concanavalin A-like superfamily)
MDGDFVARVVVEGAYRDSDERARLMLRLDAETCI